MPDDDERDLLVRFAQGDRDAFERLFRRHEREVYRWIARIVREPSAAEDALVEAFWAAYRSRARFDPSRSFGAWMRRIATHAAIDQVNAARRRGWISLDDLDLDTVGRAPPRRSVGRVPRHHVVGRVPLSHGEGMRSGPAEQRGPAVPDPMIADSIARAFRALPTKLQVVATLALIEARPHAEIAEALDVPLGTVKSRLFRATRALRKELARLGVHT